VVRWIFSLADLSMICLPCWSVILDLLVQWLAFSYFTPSFPLFYSLWPSISTVSSAQLTFCPFCLNLRLLPYPRAKTPSTIVSKLWNFSTSSLSFSLICTTFHVSTSTDYAIISSCIHVAPSICSSYIILFSSSNYAIICIACSWRGSNLACLSCFFVCVVLNSVYNFFMS